MMCKIWIIKGQTHLGGASYTTQLTRLIRKTDFSMSRTSSFIAKLKVASHAISVCGQQCSYVCVRASLFLPPSGVHCGPPSTADTTSINDKKKAMVTAECQVWCSLLKQLLNDKWQENKTTHLKIPKMTRMQCCVEMVTLLLNQCCTEGVRCWQHRKPAVKFWAYISVK